MLFQNQGSLEVVLIVVFFALDEVTHVIVLVELSSDQETEKPED